MNSTFIYEYRSQRQGPSVGEAGNRLVANSLPHHHHGNGGGYQSNNSYQGGSNNGSRPALLNGPPQMQQVQGRGRYDQGYHNNSQYNRGGQAQGGRSTSDKHYNDRSSMHSRGQPAGAPYANSQYPPVNGYYNPPAHQICVGPPSIGGPGLVPQGTVGQQGRYPQTSQAPLFPVPPIAGNTWAMGAQGVQPPIPQPYGGHQQSNPRNNSFSVLDNRGRGQQGRGRSSSGQYNQNRY